MFQSKVEQFIEQIEIIEMTLAADLSDQEVEDLLAEDVEESADLAPLNFH